VESAGKRDKGRMFELLLLFSKYVRLAFGVGRGKCRASPVRGMAGGGGKAGQSQGKGVGVVNM